MSHIKWRAKVVSAPPKSYAAIDLGTNACRLLIATDTWDIIDSHSEAVGLGKNLKRMGTLCPHAQDRAIDSLRCIQKKLNKHNLVAIRAVATEACRQASNADAFIERVKHHTGIALEVISSAEEARLASDGCIPLLSKDIQHSIIFDIGGGSTQLVLLENGRFVDSISIPYGVITLQDHMGTRTLDTIQFQEYSQYIQSYITPLADRMSHIKHLQLLGASGTITTLTASHLKMRRYSRRAIDGTCIDMDTVIHLSKHIAKIDNHIRANEPCIGVQRAPLMPAGCVILHAICQAWYTQNTTQKIRVADRGIREGILLGLMHRTENTGDNTGHPPHG